MAIVAIATARMALSAVNPRPNCSTKTNPTSKPAIIAPVSCPY